MITKMNSKVGIFDNKTDNPFVINDIHFMDDQYLFMTDLTFGIFVFRFKPRTFEYGLGDDVYLYNLNSNPNSMHFEVPNHNEYILTVNSVKNNEVLVFQSIPFNANKTAAEILKLDRIHAFLIPKYYAFGTFTSINSNFIINELYNSIEKTVSIRVSSRAKNSLNDSTLKVLDLYIPISSVVYLGFVENYSNLFILVTSNDIRLFSIQHPYIKFDATNTDMSIFKDHGTHGFAEY